MSLLEQIEAVLKTATPEQVHQLQEYVRAHPEGQKKWHPYPGNQTLAYYSPADVLLFGGTAGPGKTELLLGLAFNEHQRSLLMRRKYTDLGAIIDRAIQINGTKEGLNRSPPPRLKTADGRMIDFGAANHPGDEQGWQGQAHDGLFFDEVVHFLEKQVRFLMGWLRTTDQNQRTRVVMATNPPVEAQGDWIIGMFRPWLDITHERPAKHGELRWFVTAPDGKDIEVEGPSPVQLDGHTFVPLSRTFIPGKREENLALKSEYQAQLDNMQEPWRSALRDGNFMAARSDADSQVIPGDWVRAAMKRWQPTPPSGLDMTAIGVDVAISQDQTVLAPRYDYWYAPLIAVPGSQTPTYSQAAALIVQHRRNEAAVVVDCGGGYGGGVVTCLSENGITAHKFNGATTGWGRTKDNALSFYNKRAEAWWRFREALDPDQEFGSPVMLPDDPILYGDLTAPTFEIRTRGILVEDKEKIKERIGRSPDRGDSAVMAWSEGTNALLGRLIQKDKKPQMQAVMGHSAKKRRLMHH